MSLQYENEPEVAERQVTPGEFLQMQKTAMRRRSWWAIGVGGLVIVANIAVVWVLVNYFPEYLQNVDGDRKGFFQLLTQNVLFLLGAFFLAGGIYGLYAAAKLTIEDVLPSPEAILFLREAANTKPVYTYVLIACLILVTIFQLKIENVGSVAEIGRQSALIAGLDKPLVWQGEWWRILTYATLHGFFPLHLYFNAQAFYGFGSLIEAISNRAHVAIVFLLSVIGGGLLSIFFMPEVPSLGASGGIMGLIGYLAVYGYRRKRQLPADFLRNMLVNIGFIAAFGLIAWNFIDNFAHLGGLLVGVLYGFVQIPGNLHKNPRRVGRATELIGLAALAIFMATSIFSILLLLRIV